MQNDGSLTSDRLILIATPGTKRSAAFVKAALGAGYRRVEVLSYAEATIAPLSQVFAGAVFRFDSPSGCPASARTILTAGIVPMEQAGALPIRETEIDSLEFGRGEILHPRQWYLGFCEVLRRIETRLEGMAVRWMSGAASIITTFDKIACLDRWKAVGLPTPHRHPSVRTYHQLREQIPDRHARLFLKLRYGYSAMGAVALEWRDSLVRAITTVEVNWSAGRPRLFVSKRPKVLLNEFAINWLIDTLAMEEIVIEDWIPKARWQGIPYDLRVVMINGEMRHVVGRANSSPFTNLNLDAQRVPHEFLQNELASNWGELEDCCSRAFGAIPGATSMGLDVLVRPCRKKFLLLEANAFGDYLPGLLHDGQTTYAAELSTLHASYSGAAT